MKYIALKRAHTAAGDFEPWTLVGHTPSMKAALGLTLSSGIQFKKYDLFCVVPSEYVSDIEHNMKWFGITTETGSVLRVKDHAYWKQSPNSWISFYRKLNYFQLYSQASPWMERAERFSFTLVIMRYLLRSMADHADILAIYRKIVRHQKDTGKLDEIHSTLTQTLATEGHGQRRFAMHSMAEFCIAGSLADAGAWARYLDAMQYLQHSFPTHEAPVQEMTDDAKIMIPLHVWMFAIATDTKIKIRR